MRLKGKTTSPSESAIQSSYFEWLELQYPKVRKVTAGIPNGGKRTKRYGARLKREGLKVGFPDTLMLTPRGKYHGAVIEFKSDSGIVSDKQTEVMDDLTKEGYLCEVCRSLEEAITFTKSYLALGSPFAKSIV